MRVLVDPAAAARLAALVAAGAVELVGLPRCPTCDRELSEDAAPFTCADCGPLPEVTVTVLDLTA